MIFKNTGIDNCWNLWDLTSSNTTWYPTYSSSVTNTLTSSTTITDISFDAQYNTDNYPMIHGSYTIATKSRSYDPNTFK